MGREKEKSLHIRGTPEELVPAHTLIFEFLPLSSPRNMHRAPANSLGLGSISLGREKEYALDSSLQTAQRLLKHNTDTANVITRQLVQ